MSVVATSPDLLAAIVAAARRIVEVRSELMPESALEKGAAVRRPDGPGFMRALREATNWIYDPQNREICEAILLGNDRDMTPALAKKTYDMFVDPKTGLYRDLKIDMDGFKVVLALRAKYGEPRRELGAPTKYVDLELYRKAFPDAPR